MTLTQYNCIFSNQGYNLEKEIENEVIYLVLPALVFFTVHCNYNKRVETKISKSGEK